MTKILLFGGTMEGRILAELLNEKEIPTCVCVATEYGEKLLPKGKHIKILSERLTEKQMEVLMKEHAFQMVIDATHPYALVVSENIRKACEKRNLEYVRVLRKKGQVEGPKIGQAIDQKTGDDFGQAAGKDLEKTVVWVNSLKEAVEYLKNTSGRILITTGSKELREFTALAHYKERCYARVLTSVEVIKDCLALGFLESQIICMQGPFQKELNVGLLKQIKATYLVTKESGDAGGFMDKLEAARETGTIPIVIGRPKDCQGLTIKEAKEMIHQRYLVTKKRRVTLLGIGMGNEKTLTTEGIEVLKGCQLIIGAKRVIKGLLSFHKDTFVSSKNDEIIEYINEHIEYEDIVIAFSGDIGFYSGAKRLRPYLQAFEVNNIPGISSPIYLLSKMGLTWEDVTFISLHGLETDIVEKVKSNRKVFALLGGNKSVSDISKELLKEKLGKVRITVGENLSYENERIITRLPGELIDITFDPLAVIYIENESVPAQSYHPNMEDKENDQRFLEGNHAITHGIRDEEFIRGHTPMTKCEVRSVSISKLDLRKNAIVYDVGAGTGSVSIEVARLLEDGKVYAIEKNAEAQKLIEENRKKFHLSNVKIVGEEATACIDSLPIPTHVFIGGSSGNLSRILELVFSKNPKARVVLNAVSLECLGETVNLVKTLPVKETEIVQVSVAKSKELGDYHLMMGQNPVYVISFTGNG